MRLCTAAPAALLVIAVIAASSPAIRGHNISHILGAHPEFSTFNHYLTLTRLASEINRRLTITVLAVDNAGMSGVLGQHYTIDTIRNVLKLHVLVDYFGAKKLHQLTGGSTTSASMFQATGSAPGTSGYVNITDGHAGHVTFTAQDAGVAGVSFVKSVKEIPYNISVIQISSALSSPAADAPTAGPAPVNLTTLMSAKDCKLFAELLEATGQDKTFQDNIESGLTVFCPVDEAVSGFMPKYKNLTADGKAALLLYHGYPVYNSIQMLKQSNGVVNTLATDGGRAKNFNFTVQNDGEVVTIKTRIVTASIKTTVIDQDPLAVYTIDKMLEPRELFKVPEPPAEAPAPAAAAHSPKGSKGSKGKGAASSPDADSPDATPADEKAADDNAATRSRGTWIAGLLTAVALAAAA